MRSRRDPVALAKIAAIRTAQRAEAQQTLMLADAAEREARVAARDADTQMEVAASAWHDHLAGHGFAPEFAQALAGQLIDRVDAAHRATAHSEEMAVRRDARQADWHASDARLQQARDVLDDSRRARVRRRDERSLDWLTDRITFDWSRA